MYRLPIPEIIAQLEAAQPPCISLYLRAEATPDRVEELLTVLEEAPAAHPEVAPLLRRIRQELLGEIESGPGFGQAIFVSPTLRMSAPIFSRTGDRARVGDRFDITPLLRELSFDRPFYLLDLSRQHVRFARGTASGLEEIPVAGLPTSARASREERALEAQWGGGTLRHDARGVRRSSHEIPRFLEALEEHLLPLLESAPLPLVLAAPADLHCQVRQRFRRHCLPSGGLIGDFGDRSLEELHRETWPLIHSEIEREKRRLRERFRLASAKGLTARGYEDVLAAHRESRLESLLLRDPLDSDETEALPDEALERITRLAERMLREEVPVYFFSGDEMPAGTEVAALLRW